MGESRLCFLSLPLNVSPQIDRGIDYEHEGDRIGVLIVAFSTFNPRLPSIACNCPNLRIMSTLVSQHGRKFHDGVSS